MWDTILDILIDKVKQGVEEVRVMYDDAGCITTLPQDYYLTLRRLGIQAKVFNPIKPRLAMQMNNPDHRKILVIDGKVGMTGGINLADEYDPERALWSLEGLQCYDSGRSCMESDADVSAVLGL